ncbi:ankycorbin-like [Lingula anatina]|uniref:Ankycorbin-like n=1 Tax=Lingula anatina TaxID=7574 RepID=A0A1S3IQE7_LINAN|nr:ankycorbin-like [Lingula anatina]|eukprot:XP_013400293.1 ankycorbin-like [Lingula anatina]
MGQAASRQEAFWEACGFGRIQKVEEFIQQGIDVNWVSYTHNSCPIHVASQGKAEIVQMLIDAGCNVNVVDDRGNLALHHAAMKGHADIMEMLIKAGSEINTQDKNGWSPLITACYWCQPECVKLLIDSNCDVNLMNKDLRTALHETCRSRTQDEDKLGQIAAMLIDAGCDVDLKSSDEGEADFTPLMFASYHGHPGVAQALIDAKCDATTQGTNLWTALHWAVDRGHGAVVRVLLEAGLDPTVKGVRGETAVERARSNDIRALFGSEYVLPEDVTTPVIDDKNFEFIFESASGKKVDPNDNSSKSESSPLTENADGSLASAVDGSSSSSPTKTTPNQSSVKSSPSQKSLQEQQEDYGKFVIDMIVANRKVNAQQDRRNITGKRYQRRPIENNIYTGEVTKKSPTDGAGDAPVSSTEKGKDNESGKKYEAEIQAEQKEGGERNTTSAEDNQGISNLQSDVAEINLTNSEVDMRQFKNDQKSGDENKQSGDSQQAEGGKGSSSANTEEDLALKPREAEKNADFDAAQQLTKKMADWSIIDVRTWLDSLGLDAETVTTFMTAKIRGKVLEHLTMDDMKEVVPDLAFGDKKLVLIARDAWLAMEEKDTI